MESRQSRINSIFKGVIILDKYLCHQCNKSFEVNIGDYFYTSLFCPHCHAPEKTLEFLEEIKDEKVSISSF